MHNSSGPRGELMMILNFLALFNRLTRLRVKKGGLNTKVALIQHGPQAARNYCWEPDSQIRERKQFLVNGAERNKLENTQAPSLSASVVCVTPRLYCRV
jgi:hypothetical protein